MLTSFYSQRKAFQRNVLAALQPLLRKTPWKKHGCWLFMQTGKFFMVADISVYFNTHRTTIEFSFKPMAIDPLLWQILDIPEAQKAPLSLRANGAFVCDGLPFLKKELELPNQPPSQVAEEIIQTLEVSEPLLQAFMKSGEFSELLLKHENQVERDAYALTLVTSMLEEGKVNSAHELALFYRDSGRIDKQSNGQSFYELTLAWIEAHYPGISAARIIH